MRDEADDTLFTGWITSDCKVERQNQQVDLRTLVKLMLSTNVLGWRFAFHSGKS